MSNYINRDNFIADQRKQHCDNCFMSDDFGLDPCPVCWLYSLLKDAGNYPAADVREVVYCKDCRYLPTGHSGFDLEWPEEEDYRCPFHCTDGWYSEMPKPDFFCANGERKEETE